MGDKEFQERLEKAAAISPEERARVSDEVQAELNSTCAAIEALGVPQMDAMSIALLSDETRARILLDGKALP